MSHDKNKPERMSFNENKTICKYSTHRYFLHNVEVVDVTNYWPKLFFTINVRLTLYNTMLCCFFNY